MWNQRRWALIVAAPDLSGEAGAPTSCWIAYPAGINVSVYSKLIRASKKR